MQSTVVTLKLSSKNSREDFQKAGLRIIISRSRDEAHKNGEIVASLNPSQHRNGQDNQEIVGVSAQAEPPA